MPKLLIMACPYCGAATPPAEDIPQGYGGDEAVIVWCMACGERCKIERYNEEIEENE